MNIANIRIEEHLKRYSFCRIAALVLLVLTACQSRKEKHTTGTMVIDDLGREVNISEGANRFLALSASLTEILAFVCDTQEIVGRTPHCDYPSYIQKKTVVGNYPVDFETLYLLKPDLVFIKEGMISLDYAAKMEAMGIPVYYQKYETVEDVFSGIKRVGELTGHKIRAQKKVDSLIALKESIRKRTEKNVPPKVLIVISSEKIFVYGKNSYATDILETAGARNAVDTIFAHPFPQLTSEYILKINPEVILATKEVDLQKGFFELHPELKKIKAYKEQRLYTLSDNLIARPGPRIIDGIMEIYHFLHGQE